MAMDCPNWTEQKPPIIVIEIYIALVLRPHSIKRSSAFILNEEKVVNEPKNPVENAILNNEENRFEFKDKNNPMVKHPSRLTINIPEERGRKVRENN